MKHIHNVVEFSGDGVTDTLMRAVEKASEIEPTHVLVVLYNMKDNNGSYDMACVSNSSMTVETANWLADKLKEWLLREHGD